MRLKNLSNPASLRARFNTLDTLYQVEIFQTFIREAIFHENVIKCYFVKKEEPHATDILIHPRIICRKKH